MPLPLIFLAGAGLAAVFGTGKSVRAICRNNEAKRINNYTRDMLETAIEKAEKAKNSANTSLENLGKLKFNVLNDTVSRYISVYDQIHNIKLDPDNNPYAVNSCVFDKKEFSEIRSLSNMAVSMAGGILGGAGAGALSAFGAYSATMTLATASTGTAIASLSGAAATNATLVFLGGGPLAASGGGIVLGSTVLGALAVGPAIAVLGIVLDATAKKNLNRAMSDRYKAEKEVESLKTVVTLCNGIHSRTTLFCKLLAKLATLLDEFTDKLELIIASSGTDYSKYSATERKLLAMSLSLLSTIKKLLDTPILDKDGALTKESEERARKTREYLLGQGITIDTSVRNDSPQKTSYLWKTRYSRCS